LNAAHKTKIWKPTRQRHFHAMKLSAPVSSASETASMVADGEKAGPEVPEREF
jgi:hypothetical protein